ncbi:hypothetical protein IB238_14860 [Rhizobium sp. ARZ01]|uniref:helix-turn-helix transcriptional regulator n=1 Tax=Rhizobium sp. ARZ01 TaxID=2769313 RepID=UPI001787555E|nr:hypothetical protein [Rhizobium sp. ARZ01]MBD9373906.1 hypothetical protein [Rhizobium sp. ARZ01]
MEDDVELVDRIYEAAVIPELWSSVIERIAEVTGSFGGSIYTSGAGFSAIAASENCKIHLEDMISQGWAEKNIRAQRLISQKCNYFTSDSEWCDEEEFINHPIYTEFLRPRGLGWTAATYIVGASGDFAIFSIDQLHERGPISTSVIAYLNGLRPHIARASALATRVRQEQESNTLSHLEALGIPALLVSYDGRVQRINSLFEAISHEILIGAQDRLALRDARAHGLLKEALRRSNRDMVVQSVPVLARDGTVPVVLHVVPLRRQARDLFARTEFIVTVASLSTAKGDLSELLSTLYDLTASETRVAKNLCLGESIRSISERYDVSVETVRTQVKRVLSKTGMSRQSELISRFSTLKLLDEEDGGTAKTIA